MAGTMSHWEVAARKRGFVEYADAVHTEKLEDLRRLRFSGLPQFDLFQCTYLDFNRGNEELMEFIEKYLELGQGFCVRALPTEEGASRGLTRKHKLGFMDFKFMKCSLAGYIQRDRELFDVGLSNWEPAEYGGIFIEKRKGSIVGLAKEEDGGAS